MECRPSGPPRCSPSPADPRDSAPARPGASSCASAGWRSAGCRCRNSWQHLLLRQATRQVLPPHLHGRRAEPPRTVGPEARRARPRSAASSSRSDRACPGVTVGELLPLTSRQMHHFAQVRSVHHGINDHNAGSYYMLTGRSPVDGSKLIQTDSRHARSRRSARSSRSCGPVDKPIPPYVLLPEFQWNNGVDIGGQKAGFLGAKYDPFVGGDPSLPDYAVPGLDSSPKCRSTGSARATTCARRSTARSATRAEAAAADRMSVFQRKAVEIVASPETRARVRPVAGAREAPRALRHRPRQRPQHRGPQVRRAAAPRPDVPAGPAADRGGRAAGDRDDRPAHRPGVGHAPRPLRPDAARRCARRSTARSRRCWRTCTPAGCSTRRWWW